MSELDSEGLHVARPGTIRTFTNLRVDPLNMTPEDVSIADIAHALALQCRYNGHSFAHLSVARHSLWVSEHLEPLGRTMALWGLLHDASETYLGDMVRPLKHAPEMGVFIEAEERLDAVIAEAFGLPFPMPAAVHEADAHVLTERELPEPDGARYTYGGNADADETEFLARYAALTRTGRWRANVATVPATILIGITGKKRSGKDTAASFLVEKQGFARLAFADKLRAVALGADPYVWDGAVALGADPYVWDGGGAHGLISRGYARLSVVVDRLGWEKAKELPDVRRLLQRLGTEGVRENLGYSTWIDAAFADVKSGGRYVFTDCRFDNEAEAVRARGGRVWQIVRPTDDHSDAHASERDLPAELVDRVIVNDGTRADLRRAVLAEWTPA